MLRNTAGQIISAQMTTIATGLAFSGSVVCYVTLGTGTQTLGSVGSGACAAEGNGEFSYAPAAAETDAGCVKFTFVGTGAFVVTQTVYPQTAMQTGDSYAVVSHGTHGLSALKTLLETTGIKVASIANGAIAAATFAANALDAVWTTATRSLTTFGSLVSDNATAVWAAATRTLTAIGDSAGVTTLLGRPSPLDAAGVRSAVGMTAANLDTQLSALPTDADVQTATGAALATYGAAKSSELPVAPDNAGIAAAKYAADAAANAAGIAALSSGANKIAIDAIPTDPLRAGNYVAPDNAGIASLAVAVAAVLRSDDARLDALANLDAPVSGVVVGAIDTTALAAELFNRGLARESTVLAQFGVTYGLTYPLVRRDGLITVPRGDVFTITWTAPAAFPLLGKKVYFCVQRKHAKTNDTAIINRAMTITSVENRTCILTTTEEETATADAYKYEIEIRNTDESAPATAESGVFNVIDDLRK